MTHKPETEYFKANGWPSNMGGSLRAIADLDQTELRALALLYAKVLQTEFQSITAPAKVQPNVMVLVFDAIVALKPSWMAIKGDTVDLANLDPWRKLLDADGTAWIKAVVDGRVISVGNEGF